ncbi:ArsR/SmtB family transcription factor [Micromonospora krabiensis]|uniref:Helix-turn-helix domain-containing protein n=1 Tax=Micromonospora krabiensis TaxID=307121 RepID=A0A1C3N572_9ACTN|nr:winged helix-turn-helix domain-containing protein [Micromonospora krabiensis]SBV27742.1 Helix-turn-helix domain-containing protein [Micromonospora krabiensis]
MPTDLLPDQPRDEQLEVTSAEQFKALGHAFRHRLLFALGQRPATISQLAASLGAAKGTVAHHLGVLRDAGMVRVVHTRPVRGGTEQYYQRAARRLIVSPGHPGATGAMFGAIAEEIAAAADEPLLLLRHLRLTATQAERLRAALLDLVENAEDAGADEPRHGMLVSLYRQGAGPPPDPAAAPSS